MKTLSTPLDPEKIEDLQVGEAFEVSGRIFTARDAAHEKLLNAYQEGSRPPIPLGDLPCFHCGPVMKKTDQGWSVVSAGPTTSIRMEMFEPDFMKAFGTRMFIGKGGMGEDTSDALKKHGGVYAQFTGGAGSLMAGAMKEVEEVLYLDELGVPEAIWVFKVEQFGPLLVTMDSDGASTHRQLSQQVEQNLDQILATS